MIEMYFQKEFCFICFQISGNKSCENPNLQLGSFYACPNLAVSHLSVPQGSIVTQKLWGTEFSSHTLSFNTTQYHMHCPSAGRNRQCTKYILICSLFNFSDKLKHPVVLEKQYIGVICFLRCTSGVKWTHGFRAADILMR